MMQHGPGMRRHGMIPSLHPSSTEILLALGLGSRIGAVSADSASMPEAASLPRLNLKPASPSSKVGLLDVLILLWHCLLIVCCQVFDTHSRISVHTHVHSCC